VIDYLVTYGQTGYLGRFPAALALQRGDRVVVRTVRGVELASVLGGVGNGPRPDLDGEFIRPASAQDAADFERRSAQANAVLADAQSLAESLDLPLLFLDGEVLLDGEQAILHAVHWADCNATPLFEQLSTRHGLAVKLADLTTSPRKTEVCAACGEEKSGCSSCGTGGGCSSGSCAKGSVKSADELTAYFAGLRRQMEAVAPRVSLH
jgi:hypothetical protein